VGDRARLERDGDLGVLVIDHEPLNLFDAQMVRDILEGLDEAEGCRALLIRAEGRYFTGGVDVNVFNGLSQEQAARLTKDLLAITHRIERLPFPTLASVHALCLTAGLELALACDMIWAAESAQFGLVEAVIGLTPLMGGTQRIAERAGPARARELVMTGALYDAATLERWHVVNRVLPDAELQEKSLRFAQRLASGPTRAHHATKRVVRTFLDEGVVAADERTAPIGAPLFETEDLKRAVAMFLDGGPGKASFEGR
jgi:enoyl-CoA hydratase/carnithine racemase